MEGGKSIHTPNSAGEDSGVSEEVKPSEKKRPTKKEKFIFPLGLRYFHAQKQEFINLLFTTGEKKLKKEYEKITSEWIVKYWLRVALPCSITYVLAFFCLPSPYREILATAATTSWMLGYNYEECKAGEKISKMIERYKSNFERMS